LIFSFYKGYLSVSYLLMSSVRITLKSLLGLELQVFLDLH